MENKMGGGGGQQLFPADKSDSSCVGKKVNLLQELYIF